MIWSSFHLFAAVSAGGPQLKQELERPLLRNIFSHNSSEMLLTLTENYILMAENNKQPFPTHYLPLNF